ncbi:hypothetical protein DK427_16870 [Methylobacterium radiodurans]|uniref:Uncharacterized protein n=1 Tax=Methylobacterium radiodurans TaxID=2202828 RepID=A0A2U8VU42_9HYPH|nr:hypothetical protein DK427_16870 [Methylobacterium radiodurans]
MGIEPGPAPTSFHTRPRVVEGEAAISSAPKPPLLTMLGHRDDARCGGHVAGSHSREPARDDALRWRLPRAHVDAPG